MARLFGHKRRGGCLFRISYPNIVVLQTAQDGDGDHSADPLHSAP